MKILLDGKEHELSFGSFFKGYLLSWLLVSAVLVIGTLLFTFAFV